MRVTRRRAVAWLSFRPVHRGAHPFRFRAILADRGNPALNGVIFCKRPYINAARGPAGQAGAASAERPEETGQAGNAGMWRLFKALIFLAILAAIGLVAFAYVGPILFPAEFAAPQEEVTVPVDLDLE